MQVLDNGMVQISNQKTGQTKVVSPDDLPKYGIAVSAYGQALSQKHASPSTTVAPTPQPIPTTPTAPTQPAAQPHQDFLSNVFKAITDPGKKYLQLAGEGLGDLGRSAAYGINKVTDAATGQNTADRHLIEQKPMLMNQNEIDDAVAHPVETAAKRTAGAASYVLPGGATLKTALAAGAAAGGAYGFSESQRGHELQDTASGAVAGGLTGGVLHGGGQVVNGVKSLFGNLGNKAVDNAAQSFSKASPATISKGITEHGIDINGLVKEHVPAGAGYDDMIGTVDQRGNGGIIGTKLDEAEQKIQTAISQSGDKIVATARDLKQPLVDQLNDLNKSPVGNQEKIAQLKDFINQIDQTYPSGATATQLLDIKRAGDSTFGKAVVEDTTGTITSQVQKMMANKSREILKGDFPDIKDALGTQSDLLTLKPVLVAAKAKDISGGKFQPGQVLNPFNVPKTIDSVAQNPEITSSVAQMGPKEAAASATPSKLSGVFSDVAGQGTKDLTNIGAANAGITGGNLLTPGGQEPQPENNIPQDPNNPTYNEQTGNSNNHDMTSISQPGGNSNFPYSKDQLTKEFATQMAKGDAQGRANAAVIMQALDKFYPQQGVGKLTAQQQLNKISAESGLANVQKLEELIKSDPNIMVKANIPGGLGARTYITAKKEAADVLTRLRTGAALNEDEMKFYQSQLPEPGDTPKDIEYKLNLFKNVYTKIINQGAAAPDVAAPTP